VDESGFIEIKITGSKENIELTPDNYDIREIVFILENVEHLLAPGKNNDRPIISYKIENGSVKHIFKTSIQFIIHLNELIGHINKLQNIDFLDSSIAKAFENIQDEAKKQNYIFDISTSLENTNKLRIDSTTKFYISEKIWVNAEFYFLGKIVNAGGKNKANIHILTEEFGTVKIQTPISFLEQYDENILYKTFVIRAIGKQNAITGEIDTSTLEFIDLINYQPKYDAQYLNELRDKAKKSWLGNINPDEWLNEIRGRYDK